MNIGVKGPYLEKTLELFAWGSLVLAFIVGYIAAQPEYLPLAKKHYPEFDWTRTEAYPGLPIAFVSAPEVLNTALVIASGKGYGGPFVLGVKAERGEDTARIKEVVVFTHTETPPYLQKLVRQKFFNQFINKTVTDNFLFGEDVDGISGATISSRGFTRAIADAVHKGAQQHLGLEKTWKEREWSPGLNEALMMGLLLCVLVVVYAPRKIARPVKVLLPFAVLGFVGFYANASISLGTLAGIAMGYIPDVDQHPIWWLMVGGTAFGILFMGRNVYCSYLCPFQVVQTLLQKIGGIKFAITPAMAKNARRVIFVMSWLALMLIFLSRHPALGSYEPFSMMFSLEGMGIQWYILPLSLLGSFLIPEFWCRLFCPVGLYLSEAVRFRNSAITQVKKIVVKDLGEVVDIDHQTSSSSDILTVLYATQTGNARRIANQLRSTLKINSLPVRVRSLAGYSVSGLAEESHVIIITSTYGEGDPPDDAVALHEQLIADDAPDLRHLNYGVLGLGDSAYIYFCQTSIDLDERLAALGAQRMLDRGACDVDYEEVSDNWIMSAVSSLQNRLEPTYVQTTAPAAQIGPDRSYYHKQNPFTATLLENRRLVEDGSDRDFRHVAISLDGSGISYKPGDLLGVWFHNDPEEVQELLNNLQIDPATEVKIDGKTLPIRQALVENFELTQCYPGFIKAYAAISNEKALADIAADTGSLREFVVNHQVFELVRKYPASVSAEQFIGCLRRLTPRRYSIASSQAEVGDQVHLLVALLSYQADDHRYFGGASGYMSHRVSADNKVRIYPEVNENFVLPQEGSTPIIMIGPGTGVAPFRAFLQERRARMDEGKNWLFFGNQHRNRDFLYEEEWRAFAEQGVLTRLDLAFSRDQQEKVYVQHRIAENAVEFFEWLEGGAYLYVCGDASQMVADVENTIVQLIEQQSGRSPEEARQYLEQMKIDRRYMKDVY